MNKIIQREYLEHYFINLSKNTDPWVCPQEVWFNLSLMELQASLYCNIYIHWDASGTQNSGLEIVERRHKMGFCKTVGKGWESKEKITGTVKDKPQGWTRDQVKDALAHTGGDISAGRE